jgi:hypothetical protein
MKTISAFAESTDKMFRSDRCLDKILKFLVQRISLRKNQMISLFLSILNLNHVSFLSFRSHVTAWRPLIKGRIY